MAPTLATVLTPTIEQIMHRVKDENDTLDCTWDASYEKQQRHEEERQADATSDKHRRG